MWFWIGLIVGAVIGFLGRSLSKQGKPVGTIFIYENDEDGGEPYMFLELEPERGVGYLLEQKCVVFKTEMRRNPARK